MAAERSARTSTGLVFVAALALLGSGCYELTYTGDCQGVFMPSVEMNLPASTGPAAAAASAGPFRLSIRAGTFSDRVGAHVSGSTDAAGPVEDDMTGEVWAWWVSGGIQGRVPSASEEVETRFTLGGAVFGIEYDSAWFGTVPGAGDASGVGLGVGGGVDVLARMRPGLAAVFSVQGYFGFGESVVGAGAGVDVRLSSGAYLRAGWRWARVRNCDPGAPDDMVLLIIPTDFDGGHVTEFTSHGPWVGLVLDF